MRELKFRVWDKLEKEWCSFHPQICSGGVKGAFEFSGSQYQRKNLVILQYTGLKDKSGKEIYEGDILKLEDIIEEIRYEDDSGGYIFLDDFASLFVGNATIVGNIFENPELLK